ncbi:hypothetical protein [Mycolicibacterium iranicum]|uniref:MalT-like TPR region domain-containing protein n=1 Tax=Mycolicibacterium iranicum TaxID=912594 RepID=A0A178LQZ6_MYCIR|nr:hypothetical protein [Mycolicibacterium iranicum]OAN34454.1 hypothetical protein A4X20_07045 [Mycolicibacterium iranicum]
MSTPPANTANALERAAFGSNPGAWPLPPADNARELWLRAVVAGGQGHYAGALADLDRLRHCAVSDSLASLASSTRASFLRQLGWHDLARRWDGRAAALAHTEESLADAMIGLAADALGVGRFAASGRALGLAAEQVRDCRSDRLPIRLAWVSAELAMFRGDGAAAVPPAEKGMGLASDYGSVRHMVKSRVVLAAALCSAGDLPSARREGEAALDQAIGSGLVPLQWAVSSLLSDIADDARSASRFQALRDESAEKVIRWGGVWRPR